MSADDREHRFEEFARRLSARIDELKGETARRQVVDLRVVRGNRQEPQLTDAELVVVRRMLQDFETIAYNCPTARRLLERE